VPPSLHPPQARNRFHFAIKPSTGSGSEELVLESAVVIYLDDVSPDGAFLLYTQFGRKRLSKAIYS
jgi:hypothetical protein